MTMKSGHRRNVIKYELAKQLPCWLKAIYYQFLGAWILMPHENKKGVLESTRGLSHKA
jgi:hypothetical protein